MLGNTALLQQTCDWIQARDFDCPFTLTASGMVWDTQAAPYHGTVLHDPEGDVTIETPDWHAMTGLTNQHGYNGAVLHSSEQMSPGVVRAMMETITARGYEAMTFVLTPVEILPDDEDPDPFPAGWTILYHHRA